MERVTSDNRFFIGRCATPRTATARVSSISAAISAVSLLALHAVSPELDPTWRMVSEYALGNFGGILALMFAALAVSSFALAAGIRSEVTTLSGKIGLVLLLAAGIGMTMAAVFDVRHGLHGVAALIGIPSMTIAPLVLSLSLRRDPACAPSRKSLLLIAHLVWISLVVLVATMFIGLARSGGEMGPGIWVGIPNRVLVFAYAAWSMLASRH